MNFSYGMVIQPNDRIGSAVIGSLPPAYCLFYRPECIVLTQHDPLKNGSMRHFHEKWFSDSDSASSNQLWCKFSEFFDNFKIFTKLRPIILRDRSKAKPACATCQPPVVLKSSDHRRSFSIDSLYYHDKSVVHSTYPSYVFRGQGTLSQRFYLKRSPVICCNSFPRCGDFFD